MSSSLRPRRSRRENEFDHDVHEGRGTCRSDPSSNQSRRGQVSGGSGRVALRVCCSLSIVSQVDTARTANQAGLCPFFQCLLVVSVATNTSTDSRWHATVQYLAVWHRLHWRSSSVEVVS